MVNSFSEGNTMTFRKVPLLTCQKVEKVFMFKAFRLQIILANRALINENCYLSVKRIDNSGWLPH